MDRLSAYEKLITCAENSGYLVREIPLKKSDGLCYGDILMVNDSLPTSQKYCTLAEEYAHAVYSAGNIINQSDTAQRKIELYARHKAYEKLAPLDRVQLLSRMGYQMWEIAEELGIAERFLHEALRYYESKYGDIKEVPQ